MNSLRDKRVNWQSLEHKISNGFTLSQACEHLGIDEQEAIAYLSEKSKLEKYDSDILRLCGFRAIQTALEALEQIVKDGPRIAMKDSETYYNTDLQAAKELLKFGMDVRKLAHSKDVLKSATKGEGSGPDLFDMQGPWDFNRSTQGIR